MAHGDPDEKREGSEDDVPLELAPAGGPELTPPDPDEEAPEEEPPAGESHGGPRLELASAAAEPPPHRREKEAPAKAPPATPDPDGALELGASDPESALELAVVKDEPRSSLIPVFRREDEEEDPGSRLERVVELDRPERRPPTLEPLDVGGILSWPFTGENAFSLVGGLFAVLMVLMCAWLLDRFFGSFEWLSLGGVGHIVRAVIVIGAGVWFMAYPYRVVHEAYAGRADPPHWPELELKSGVYGEGARALLLVLLYALPAALVGLMTGSAVAILILALAGWALVPAALLLLVSSESLTRAGPVLAFRIAAAGGRTYLYTVAPVVPFLAVRIFWGPTVFGAVLEWLTFAALLLSSFMVGLLARENEAVERLVLATGWLGEVAEAQLDGAEEEE